MFKQSYRLHPIFPDVNNVVSGNFLFRKNGLSLVHRKRRQRRLP
jgi:hypothetical protein